MLTWLNVALVRLGPCSVRSSERVQMKSLGKRKTLAWQKAACVRACVSHVSVHRIVNATKRIEGFDRRVAANIRSVPSINIITPAARDMHTPIKQRLPAVRCCLHKISRLVVHNS